MLQAVFLGIHYEEADAALVMLGQFATDEQVERLRKMLAERPTLPRYDLTSLADLRDGPDEVVLVALLYPDREAAARAAPVLADRFEQYRPLRLPTSLIASVCARHRNPSLTCRGGGPAACFGSYWRASLWVMSIHSYASEIRRRLCLLVHCASAKLGGRISDPHQRE